jgi:hypothetical protein
MSSVKCPRCGSSTSGKFCSECGSPLAGRSCPSCGASLSARAKFCPECGTVVAARAPGTASLTAAGQRLPWIVAGTAILALLTLVVVLVSRRPPASAATAGGGPFSAAAPATTDITQLTPQEQADRLFNRVMRAIEAGDTAQLQFFGPMTLQAYANIAPLDADQRLHVGLIQLALGAAAGAAAEADTIARQSRTHLFASALRARAADQRGDQAAARAAYRAFLDAYDAERAKNLPEYGQHETLLTETREAARRATGGQ